MKKVLSIAVICCLVVVKVSAVNYINKHESKFYNFKVNDSRFIYNPLSVNDFPVLSGIETAPITYQTANTSEQITNSLTVNDADNDLTNITFKISSGYKNGADKLSFTGGGGVGSSWNAATGTLTLTGITNANATNAVRSVNYSCDFSPLSAAERTITITANDATGGFATAVRAIKVRPILNVPTPNYPTITDAINAAVSGVTIKVAPGTYTENINFSGKNIIIEGNTSNPSAVTIQSAPDAGSVVVFNSGENSNAQLSGFTISNGCGTLTSMATPYTPLAYYGGGIFCVDASPTLSHLIVRNNHLKINGTIGSSGGGLYFRRSNATLDHVEIKDNVSVQFRGGGIAIDDCGELKLYEVSIQSNDGGRYGGGMFVRNSNIKCNIHGDIRVYGSNTLSVTPKWGNRICSINSTFSHRVRYGSGGATHAQPGNAGIINRTWYVLNP